MLIADEISRPIAPALRVTVALREQRGERSQARTVQEALDGYGILGRRFPVDLPLEMSRNRAKIAVRAFQLWRSGYFDERDRRSARHMFARIQVKVP